MEQISATARTEPGKILVIVCENRGGVPEKPGLELLSDAIQLARSLKCKVTCLYFRLSPSGNDEIPESLLNSGCHEITDYSDAHFSGQNPINFSNCIRLKTDSYVRLILLPQTPLGEEISAHLCGSLNLLWIPDILSFRATRTLELQICCIAGDNKLTKTVLIEPETTVIGTMREGIADIRPSLSKESPLIDRTIQHNDSGSLDPSVHAVVTGYLPPDPKTIDITEANRIVSAGRGTGSPEGVALTQELAQMLNASHAASRLVVDSGWVAHSRQVGMTGKTVKPSLYLACGISGASHHLMGMNESTHIVAINSDPKAPIHEIAHLSICSDLHQIIPDLMKKISDRRNKSPIN